MKRMGTMEKAESIKTRLLEANVNIDEGDDDLGIVSAAVPPCIRPFPHYKR